MDERKDKIDERKEVEKTTVMNLSDLSGDKVVQKEKRKDEEIKSEEKQVTNPTDGNETKVEHKNKIEKAMVNEESKDTLSSDSGKERKMDENPTGKRLGFENNETSVQSDSGTAKEIKSQQRTPKQTIEEKRAKETTPRMTLEEKRDLQKKVVSQEVDMNNKKMFSRFTKLDMISTAFFILMIALGIYIVYYIEHYFGLSYALGCVVVLSILAVLSFVAMRKKKKLGFVLNVFLCALLGIGSGGVYKISNFTSKILDNSETETIAIIVKTDSPIQKDSSFEGLKFAMVDMDQENNVFAQEVLEEQKKTGYEKVSFGDYEKAYAALMNKEIDFMVYSSYTQFRLQEAEVDVSDHRVVFEKTRKLAAADADVVDISSDPFTLLISGVDLTSKNINEMGSSDVNILLTVNPKTKKTSLQVIPRDLWAELPCVSCSTKLTYGGAWGGIDCSINAIENYFDISINYYAKINFQGVMDLVDVMGNIQVNSHYNFCSGSFCYQQGMNTVNGKQALQFARERKSLPEGDVSRGKHQMEVVSGVVNKFKENPSLTNLNQLMESVGNNFTTNLSSKDISKAVTLFSELSSTMNLEMNSIKGEFLWNDDNCTYEYLYYFYPFEGEKEAVKARIDSILQ